MAEALLLEELMRLQELRLAQNEVGKRSPIICFQTTLRELNQVSNEFCAMTLSWYHSLYYIKVGK